MTEALTLFPPFSLDTSILAVVVVGVLLLAVLTETLGWPFVGLVVPGYLASVFVIRPEAGATIVVEALVTYALARFLSGGLARTGAWSEFFGRERFFIIVLVSVLVRALFEAWLLPGFGVWLDERYGTTFAVDRSLHSIGLVLVPLAANAFWKLGFRRGSIQVGVPVLLTFLVLEFVLLPYTNLSFGSLELVYEDVAQTFLGSPKSYIILLTTALLAAHFNARYGWDFNGILVPALIALTLFEPAKLVATFVEVGLLVGATRALIALPGVRTLNLEGPRKVVVVFLVGFLLKWCVGWAFGGKLPGLRVTDLFGFGYLVPTLLAVKILQTRAMPRVLLGTLHTSIAGVAVGTVLGFGLMLLEPRTGIAHADGNVQWQVGLTQTPDGVMSLVRANARDVDGTSFKAPPRSEIRRFASLWRNVRTWVETEDPAAFAEVRRLAPMLSMKLQRLPDLAGRPRWALFEDAAHGELRGWGGAVLTPGAKGPVVAVPRPLAEAPSAEAAALLCERLNCPVLVASGVDTWSHAAGPAEGPLELVRGALASLHTITVRGDDTLERHVAVLHAKAAFDASPLWPEITRTEAALPGPGESVLRAHPDVLRGWVAAEASIAEALRPEGMLERAQEVCAHRSTIPVTDAELWLLREDVAAPLLRTRANASLDTDAVRFAARTADRLGLQLHPVAPCGEGRCFLVAPPAACTSGLRAGLLVDPDGEQVAFEASGGDERGALEAAFAMWRATRARALVFASDRDGVRTPWHVLHEAVDAAMPRHAGVIVDVRGFSRRPGVEASAVISLETTLVDAAGRPPELKHLFDEGGALSWLASGVVWNDGSAELVSFDVPSTQQAYARTFGGARTATLWLSDEVRGAFLAPPGIDEQLRRLGLRPPSRRPEEVLLTPTWTSTARHRKWDALVSTTKRYLEQRGGDELRALVRSGAQVFWSPEHRLPYLTIEGRDGDRVRRGVFFLQAHAGDAPVEIVQGAPDAAAMIERALGRRAPVVMVGRPSDREMRR